MQVFLFNNISFYTDVLYHRTCSTVLALQVLVQVLVVKCCIDPPMPLQTTQDKTCYEMVLREFMLCILICYTYVMYHICYTYDIFSCRFIYV